MRHLQNLLLCAALLAGGLSVASTANAAPAPAQPAAAVPVAVKYDPAKLAAAREFLMVYRPQLSPTGAKTTIDGLMPRLIARARREDPKVDAAKFEADTRQRLTAMAAKSLEMQARAVSLHFTVEELKGLRAFFAGPLGSKLIAQSREITKDILKERRIPAPGLKGAPAQMPAPMPAKAPPAKKK